MEIKTFRRGLAIVSIVGLMGGAGVTVANAASTSGDGQDSQATSCKNDARSLSTKQIRSRAVPAVKNRGQDASRPAIPSRALGNVQLVYSKKCRTVWAEVYTYAPYGRTKAVVYRHRDGKQYLANSGFLTMWSRTKMVNDAFTSSFAQGSILYKNEWFSVNTDSV